MWQVVLDCPDAEEPLCPVAEARRCRLLDGRLLDGAEPVSRQVPDEGWGEMVELAWRCLLRAAVESQDGRDSRYGLQSQAQDALVHQDGRQQGLFLCEKRSVVSGPVSGDQELSSVWGQDVPAPVSASECSVWLPQSVSWQLQV